MPTQLAIADFNGDNRPDVVVVQSPGGSATGTVQVLLGTSTGSYAAPLTTSATANLSAVAVADFNGDGKQDLAVTDSVLKTLTILIGNGDGTFLTGATYATGANPVFVVAKDINQDGKPDLLVANYNDGTYSVYLSNGDGTFTAKGAFSAGVSEPNGIAVGDLNHDGKADLAISGYDNQYSVAGGNGDGSFQLPVAQIVPGTGPMAIAMGDLNGDGQQDLVIVNDGVVVLEGNSNLSFKPPQNYAAQLRPNGLALSDLNGDGKLDIVVSNWFSNSVSVLLNRGDGTFNTAVNYSAGSVPVAIAAGDLDGDGLSDVAVLNQGDGNVEILRNIGQGVLASGYTSTFISGGTVASPMAMTTGDFDGDGHPDVAELDGAPRVNVLLNSGSYTFSLKSVLPISEVQPTAIVSGDIDGDGKLDIVVIGQNSYVFFGNGDGTFKPAVQGAIPQNPANNLHYAALGDFNGDKKLDLVVSNADSKSSVAVLLGNGDGTFQAPSFLTPGSSSSDVATFDFNNDGKQDIVVATSSSLVVFLGNGDGTFSAGQNYSYSGFVASNLNLALGDLNGDGQEDVIVAGPKTGFSPGPDSVNVFLGNPNGSFQPASSYALNAGHGGVVATDFNGDRRSDVAVGDGSSLDVFLSDVAGHLGTPSHFEAAGSSPIAAADLTGTLAPDIIVASGNDVVTVFPNTGGTHASDSSNPNPSSYQQPVQVDAALAPALSVYPAPTGTIHIAEGASSIGDIQLPAAGLSLSSLPAGTHVLQLSYSGDGNYNPRALGTITQVVNKAATTTALTSTATALVGDPVTLSAAVSGQFGGLPTGSIQFSDGSTPLSTQALDSSGKAALSISTLTLGPHTLTASYAGDQNFVVSSSSVPVDIQNPTTLTLSAGATTIVVGNSVALTATIKSSGVLPTGIVDFIADGSNTIGSASLDGSGNAVLNTTTIPGGAHAITASYRGDKFSAKSVSQAVSVGVSDFGITAQPTSATLRAGQSATITISIAGVAGFSSSVSFACNNLPALATCTFTPATVTAGTAPATTTLVIKTTGTAAGLWSPTLPAPGNAALVTLAMLGLFWFVLMGSKIRRRSFTLAILAIGCTVPILSCGGGGGGGSVTTSTAPTTPQGTTSVALVATSSMNGTNVSHQIAISITVTP